MSVKMPKIKLTYESSSSSEDEKDTDEFDIKALSSMFTPGPRFQYPVMKFEKMQFGNMANDPWNEISGNILNKFAPKYPIFDFRQQMDKSMQSPSNKSQSKLEGQNTFGDISEHPAMQNIALIRKKSIINSNEEIIKSFKKFKRLKVEQSPDVNKPLIIDGEEVSPRTYQKRITQLTKIMEQQSLHKPRSYKKIRQQQVSDVLLGKNSVFYHKMLVMPIFGKAMRRHSFEDHRNQTDNLLKSVVIDDHTLVTDFLNAQQCIDDNNSSMTSLTNTNPNSEDPSPWRKEKKRNRERKMTHERFFEKPIHIPIGRRKSDASEYAEKVKDKLSKANLLMLHSDLSIITKPKANNEDNLKHVSLKPPQRKGKSLSTIYHQAHKRFTTSVSTLNLDKDKQKRISDVAHNKGSLTNIQTLTSKPILKKEGSGKSNVSSKSRKSMLLSSDIIEEDEVGDLPTGGFPIYRTLQRKNSKSKTFATGPNQNPLASKTSLDEISIPNLDAVAKKMQNEDIRESIIEDESPASKRTRGPTSLDSKNLDLKKEPSPSPESKKKVENLAKVTRLTFKERRLMLKSDIGQMTKILKNDHHYQDIIKESLSSSKVADTATITNSSPSKRQKTKKPSSSDINSMRIKNVYMLSKKASTNSVIPPLNMELLNQTPLSTPIRISKQKTARTPLSSASSNIVRIKTFKGSMTQRSNSQFKFFDDTQDSNLQTKQSWYVSTPKTDSPGNAYQFQKTGSKLVLKKTMPSKTLSQSSSRTASDFHNPGVADSTLRKPSLSHMIKGSSFKN